MIHNARGDFSKQELEKLSKQELTEIIQENNEKILRNLGRMQEIAISKNRNSQMSTTTVDRSNDELYQIIQPILSIGDPQKRKEIEDNWEQEAEGILAWAVRSGYFLWTRQQPKPLDRIAVMNWLSSNHTNPTVEKSNDLIDPLLQLGDPDVQSIVAKNKLSLAAWGEESGYLKWARKQPQPLSRESLQEWIDNNRQACKTLAIYKTAGKKLIDLYQSVQHTKCDEETGKAILHNFGPLTLSFMNTMLDIASDQSRKYRFSQSAIDMLTYLSPPMTRDKSHSVSLPLTNTWLELETPLFTPAGVMSCMNFYRIEQLKWLKIAQKRLPVPSSLYQSMHENALSFQGKLPPNCWAFELIAPNGGVFYQFAYDPSQDTWIIKNKAPCPTCNGKGKCTECERCTDYYSSLLKTALLMISGAFAEREEAITFEKITEQAIRKLPRENNPKKTRTTIQTHTYHIVTFDACSKKASEPINEPQEKRGPWVEATQAINPDAIVYVDRHIAKTERTLRHERYVNKRNQTIPVKAHNKRIPMKVSELRRKITRVVASKYEHGESGS